MKSLCPKEETETREEPERLLQQPAGRAYLRLIAISPPSLYLSQLCSRCVCEDIGNVCETGIRLRGTEFLRQLTALAQKLYWRSQMQMLQRKSALRTRRPGSIRDSISMWGSGRPLCEMLESQLPLSAGHTEHEACTRTGPRQDWPMLILHG